MNELSPIARAEHEQHRAADPATSAFVAAHAGSGKTKLLIDRLLRLMLNGAEPSRIVCLTFTKAAAAEMAIRLQRQLGAFVGFTDDQLDAQLQRLGVAPTAENRARARALFARVLDLPGGMRIATIHAFCQSVLRRFPLEAAISPHFALFEDADRASVLRAALEAALPSAEPASLGMVASLAREDGFQALLSTLNRKRAEVREAVARAGDLAAALRRAAGCVLGSLADAEQAAITPPNEAALKHALERIAAKGSDAARGLAEKLLPWLAADPEERRTTWPQWAGTWLTEKNTPRQESSFCNQKLNRACPDILPIVRAEQARVAAAHHECRAQRTAAASAALLTVALPVLARFDDLKGHLTLDYDDLITRTHALLKQTGAAWVLYKLDGGLDHLLLDEVQDTAPEQWDIAAALTADFFAGDGATERLRTIFAVGDKKQSIFSFQGADPEGFERWRDIFGHRATGGGATWIANTLDVSFRSTAPVLRLVDAVFANPAAADGVCAPGTLSHLPARSGQAGAVEIWPLFRQANKSDSDPWDAPREYQAATPPQRRLAAYLAAWVARECRNGTLESAGRRPRPGDFLFLVQRRNDFTRALVNALKAASIPVAGLDRMTLIEEPAVADVLSLCRALLLPRDDLAFAEYLVSPLGGLADPDLLELAPARSGTLHEALRARAAENPAWLAAIERFAGLLRRVDYDGPHALIATILGEGGRARLLARFGAEAADPLAELLAAAQEFESRHPPALQSFLAWLEQGEIEIKREPEGAGGAVRVLTVHGAKGLEAPIVILPDTTFRKTNTPAIVWATDPSTGAELPLWCAASDHGGPAAENARETCVEAEARERNRLLYVALTRARDRLIVCGWERGGNDPVPKRSWYALIREGAATLPLETIEGAHPEGAIRRLACEQIHPAPPEKPRGAAAAPPLPAWLGQAPAWQPAPPPPEPALPEPLAPSRPEGVDAGPAPPFRSPLLGGPQAFARGRTIHALLQHLPNLPPEDRAAAARRYAPDHAEAALATLNHPALARLFGPGSRAEQPIAGVIGTRVVLGLIDRLRITANEILLADYKTGANPPDTPEAAPIAHLRQMAAYAAVLARLHPSHRVTALLIYTEGPTILTVPPALLAAHHPEP